MTTRGMKLGAACAALALAHGSSGVLGQGAAPPSAQAGPAQAGAAPAAPGQNTSPAPSNAPETGGVVRGRISSGSASLPGVAVTATNSLTGRKYATTTDINGRYSLKIPEDGRWVLRTDFAAFQENTSEVRFGGAAGGPRDLLRDLSLVLLSRVPAQAEDRGELGSSAPGGAFPGGRRGGGGQGRGGGQGGAQLLDLLSSGSGASDAGGAGGALGAALPGLAGNADFAADSVAVQGQTNNNGLQGIDFNALRERAENDASLGGGAGSASSPGGGGGGRGGPGGSFGGGGFGGPGGFGGGLRPSFFRHFNPNQPHGAFFWNGSNGELNARDFALRGQPIGQPAYGSNRFGLVYAGTPYIPKLLTGDKRDFLFFTANGSRSSSPFDQYGTVPSAAERAGDFSQLAGPGGAVTPIYDPATGQPFPGNVIPAARISPQAQALLGFLPLQNLPGTSRNYQLLTSQGSNSSAVSLRFVHTLGASSGGSPLGGLIRQYVGQGKGLQQNFHVNFNYAHSAADNLNIFSALSGKTQTNSRQVELGYTLSKDRLTNNLTLNWNRATTTATNNFTNTNDIANTLGLNIFNGQAANPLNYGLPDVTLTQFTGFTEQQPSFQVQQTLSLTEASSWSHHKQSLKWGADARRVQLNLLGSASLISTGSFIFSGFATERPGSSAASGVGNTAGNGLVQSGSSLADLLLGLPQQTRLQASNAKSYLRENILEGYFQDDWRALPSLTLQAGLRYEYFSPYSEKNDRLATLDPSADFTSVATVTPHTVGPSGGLYPRSLIYPEKNNFSPRLGFAWRAARNTVIRGGYGINYATGQYSAFVQQFAFQPPFADVQTNESTAGGPITLASGFGGSQQEGNYAVDRNYRLPYVQVWNLNVQRTLPANLVLNVGYNGSKGTRLSIVDAPGRSADATLSGIFYDYEQAVAFSNYNALAVSLRRRLAQGISLQATYTYAHSIDNATSVGGVGNSIAQNWQNLLAEESNSSFDIRHRVTGSAVYELPFGGDKSYFTRGTAGKLLEGLSLSGTYTIASGEPLTPAYVASVADVARGSTGSQRPDRVPGASLTAGARNATQWFNTGAFTTPAGVYGTASRFSIAGPGTIQANASASKTVDFGDTRSLEFRVTADNVFNTIQYSTVSTSLGSNDYGQVTGTAATRQFNFLARFRY